MNKRIRELAKQSGTWEYYEINEGVGEDEKHLEKFAELIIQDCLLALEPDPMAPEIDYAVEEKSYRRSAEKIKRHFGIEK
jgi:hypothetical protein